MFNFKNCRKEYKASNENNILASVSHDLRNPLSAILYAADFLEKENKNKLDQDSITLIQSIRDSEQEVLEMVSDPLDVTQVNTGEFNVNLDQKINIKEIIDRSLQLTRHLYYKKKINVDVNIENYLPEIYLDSRRMKQILVNIISNSVKYSDNATNINLNAKIIQDSNVKWLQIIIKDEGIGMDEKELKLSLKKYGVIDNKRPDSIGLGMSLIQQLVKAQNGLISIKSIKNMGTQTLLKFPIN